MGKDLADWENVNQTGYYPEPQNSWEKESEDEKLKADLISNNIQLPLNGIRTWMPEGYWKNLYDKFNP